jgi:hypothetical protein
MRENYFRSQFRQLNWRRNTSKEPRQTQFDQTPEIPRVPRSPISVVGSHTSIPNFQMKTNMRRQSLSNKARARRQSLIAESLMMELSSKGKRNVMTSPSLQNMAWGLASSLLPRRTSLRLLLPGLQTLITHFEGALKRLKRMVKVAGVSQTSHQVPGTSLSFSLTRSRSTYRRLAIWNLEQRKRAAFYACYDLNLRA